MQLSRAIGLGLGTFLALTPAMASAGEDGGAASARQPSTTKSSSTKSSSVQAGPLKASPLKRSVPTAAEPGPELGGPDGRLLAGVALLGLGGVAVIGGGIGYSVLSMQAGSCEGASAGCQDESKTGKSASIVALVLGGAGVAVGIPLVMSGSGSSFGSWRDDKRNAALPEVRVGMAAGSLSWQF